MAYYMQSMSMGDLLWIHAITLVCDKADHWPYSYQNVSYLVDLVLLCTNFILWVCVQGIYYLFVCLMVFNATLYRGGQLYWWRKSEDPEKTTDLSQVTDKFYHVMLYISPWSRFELTTSVNPNTMRSRPRRPLYVIHFTFSGNWIIS